MQAVVAISMKAGPMLSASLQAQVSLAHLALDTLLQAAVFASHSTPVGHSPGPELAVLADSIIKLLQAVAVGWQQATGKASAVAGELYIEQLGAVSSCCRALGTIGGEETISSCGLIPAEALVHSILSRQAQEHLLQVINCVNLD